MVIIHHFLDPIRHIVDVGIIPRGGTVSKDSDGLSFEDLSGKGMNRHLRSLSGAIDGEKAQGHGGNGVYLAVGLAVQFSGSLGGGIGGDLSFQRGVAVGRCGHVITCLFEDF